MDAHPAASRAAAVARLRSGLSWLPWVLRVYLTQNDNPYGLPSDSILVLYDGYQWWIPREVQVETNGTTENVVVHRRQAPNLVADTATLEQLQQAYAERRRDHREVDSQEDASVIAPDDERPRQTIV